MRVKMSRVLNPKLGIHDLQQVKFASSEIRRANSVSPMIHDFFDSMESFRAVSAMDLKVRTQNPDAYG